MTKPAKVKPLKGWAVLKQGEMGWARIYKTRSQGVMVRQHFNKTFGDLFTGPIRVRILPEPAKRKAE